jgi:hypothetical protein
VTFTVSGKTTTQAFTTVVTVVTANKGVKVVNDISRKTATMEVWSNLPVDITNLPKGATVTWSSSDKTVAVVTNTKGRQGTRVYARKAGTVTITAKVTSKASGKTTTTSYTAKITVVDANAKANKAAETTATGAFVAGRDADIPKKEF